MLVKLGDSGCSCVPGDSVKCVTLQKSIKNPFRISECIIHSDVQSPGILEIYYEELVLKKKKLHAQKHLPSCYYL